VGTPSFAYLSLPRLDGIGFEARLIASRGDLAGRLAATLKQVAKRPCEAIEADPGLLAAAKVRVFLCGRP